MLFNGDVVCQTQSSKITTITLATHGVRDKLIDLQPAELRDLFGKDVELCRFDSGWLLCQMLDDNQCWEKLAQATVFNLKVDFGKFFLSSALIH